MSDARKLSARVFPKALACGMLHDGNRVLFLVRRDTHGTERIELPCTEIFGAEDPVGGLTTEFRRQTGIDAEILEIKMQRRYNAGSRKRKRWIPCLVFSVRAKNMKAKISSEFSGFRWMDIEKAKEMKLGRKAEWLGKSKQA